MEVWQVVVTIAEGWEGVQRREGDTLYSPRAFHHSLTNSSLVTTDNNSTTPTLVRPGKDKRVSHALP
ncbi:hypothetical protein Pmani_012951 [Petrolisthes manimaculis]|uniref:Uncharacterized protein n=1 Tax=Petrolisthes manimaculis TaxID=1843537 RepID=A0AAE1PWW8_9EUCA|nr:hypothetical protein Pmani_012951 [Petrolisthes manimaculis]